MDWQQFIPESSMAQYIELGVSLGKRAFIEEVLKSDHLLKQIGPGSLARQVIDLLWGNSNNVENISLANTIFSYLFTLADLELVTALSYLGELRPYAGFTSLLNDLHSIPGLQDNMKRFTELGVSYNELGGKLAALIDILLRKDRIAINESSESLALLTTIDQKLTEIPFVRLIEPNMLITFLLLQDALGAKSDNGPTMYGFRVTRDSEKLASAISYSNQIKILAGSLLAINFRGTLSNRANIFKQLFFLEEPNKAVKALKNLFAMVLESGFFEEYNRAANAIDAALSRGHDIEPDLIQYNEWAAFVLEMAENLNQFMDQTAFVPKEQRKPFLSLLIHLNGGRYHGFSGVYQEDYFSPSISKKYISALADKSDFHKSLSIVAQDKEKLASYVAACGNLETIFGYINSILSSNTKANIPEFLSIFPNAKNSLDDDNLRIELFDKLLELIFQKRDRLNAKLENKLPDPKIHDINLPLDENIAIFETYLAEQQKLVEFYIRVMDSTLPRGYEKEISVPLHLITELRWLGDDRVVSLYEPKRGHFKVPQFAKNNKISLVINKRTLNEAKTALRRKINHPMILAFGLLF